MQYESQLASITQTDSVAGGVARVGAVRAALNAGQYDHALNLADQYRGESSLADERRAALDRVLKEFEEQVSHRFPSLVRNGQIRHVGSLKSQLTSSAHIFPAAA